MPGMFFRLSVLILLTLPPPPPLSLLLFLVFFLSSKVHLYYFIGLIKVLEIYFFLGLYFVYLGKYIIFSFSLFYRKRSFSRNIYFLVHE